MTAIRTTAIAAAVGLGLAASAVAGPKVKLETSKGDVTLELDREKAPETVKNFLTYVKDGFYDGTVFHRVIPDFMVQGGGFALQEDGMIEEKPTREPVENEAKNGLKNERGTIAMARTSEPHSATAQFFINHADNSSLDYPSFDGWGYAVFGKVVEGMDVVDEIAAVETGEKELIMRANGRTMARETPDVPLEPVVIESASVIE